MVAFPFFREWMSRMATILEKTAGLLAFVRTVDAGSFAGAARLIGASPSAVSKSVARLEQRLGVRLLQRSTRTLSPTSEGAAYYEHGRSFGDTCGLSGRF